MRNGTNLKQSQRKIDSTSNKKVSFLESLEKISKDFDRDGILTRHANGELVSKSAQNKEKAKEAGTVSSIVVSSFINYYYS